MKIFPNCKEKGSFPKSKIKSLTSIIASKLLRQQLLAANRMKVAVCENKVTPLASFSPLESFETSFYTTCMSNANISVSNSLSRIQNNF